MDPDNLVQYRAYNLSAAARLVDERLNKEEEMELMIPSTNPKQLTTPISNETSRISSTLSSFHQFRDLPKEIRIMIFEFAVKQIGPRTVRAEYIVSYGFFSDDPIPALLHATSESRKAALYIYKPWLPQFYGTKAHGQYTKHVTSNISTLIRDKIWLNFECDTLQLGCHSHDVLNHLPMLDVQNLRFLALEANYVKPSIDLSAGGWSFPLDLDMLSQNHIISEIISMHLHSWLCLETISMVWLDKYNRRMDIRVKELDMTRLDTMTKATRFFWKWAMAIYTATCNEKLKEVLALPDVPRGLYYSFTEVPPEENIDSREFEHSGTEDW